MINDAFGQDDLYVEMTFLRSMEEYGLDVSIRQAGLDFANSGYPLWCANDAGRKNLRRGVAPPDSGHPQFNKCPNDIDYQIEVGLLRPHRAWHATGFRGPWREVRPHDELPAMHVRGPVRRGHVTPPPFSRANL